MISNALLLIVLNQVISFDSLLNQRNCHVCLLQMQCACSKIFFCNEHGHGRRSIFHQRSHLYKNKSCKICLWLCCPSRQISSQLDLRWKLFYSFSENHGGHFLFSGFSRICMELCDSKIKHASLMHGKPINDMANLNPEVVIRSWMECYEKLKGKYTPDLHCISGFENTLKSKKIEPPVLGLFYSLLFLYINSYSADIFTTLKNFIQHYWHFTICWWVQQLFLLILDRPWL